MITWATKRKLTYLSIVIGFLLIVVSIPLVFFFNKAPTCSDGKMNQDENGVDCGGVCTKLCKADTTLPIVSWQRVFKISKGIYSAVAYVENPNLNSTATNVPYSFRAYDKANVLIVERKGTASILPIGVTPVFESGILTGERIPARVTFSFASKPDWIITKKIAPRITILINEKNFEGTLPSLRATITNTTLKNIPHFEVVAILYDENDNAIASSKTVVDSIAGEQEVEVVFSWREAFASIPVKVEILPKLYPDIQY